MFKLSANTEYSFSNALLIGVSATLLCKETLLVAQLNYSGYALYLLTFCTTFIAYLNSGFEKKIAGLVLNSYRYTIIVILLGVLFLTALFIPFDSKIILTLVTAVLLSLIYFEVVLLKNNLSIRKIYFAKTILLGLVWSLTTVCLPIAFAGADILSVDVLFIFSRRLLFIAALSLSFDIRDIEKDHNLGYKNIASLVGIPKTKALAFLLLAVFAALVVLQIEIGSLAKPSALAMLLSTGLAIIPIAIYNPHKKGNLILFLIDAMLIVQFLLISAFNNY